MAKVSFDVWKYQVNKEVESMVGLSCDDLDDYRYMDAWEDGKSPKATARAVIRNAGGED